MTNPNGIPPVEMKKIKVFSDEFDQIHPCKLLVTFDPHEGIIRLITNPNDYIIALGMISYAQGKILEKMLAPQDASPKLIQSPLGIHLPPGLG